jgi:NADP-dependent 3-hydroxy acid dehydrogenase YdfG
VTLPYVHNAGQSADALAAMLDRERAEAAMQVNFWSMTRIAKALVRGMIRARAGRIVAIGSVAALQANAGNAAYAATKGALIAYCRTLAIESAKRGVTLPDQEGGHCRDLFRLGETSERDLALDPLAVAGTTRRPRAP